MTQDIFLKRAYNRIQMAKWRKANPVKALELGKKHQLTWRTKNPELNRNRAKYGMRALNMYRQITKFARISK